MKPDNSKQLIRALVVDDEALARQGLELRLADIDGVEVVGSCQNGREALEMIADKEPDLMFLDIQMPGMTGFDVVEQLQQDNMPLIVFVTAYDEYAVNAFDIHAVDYLLKPIEVERLQQAVSKVRERLDHGRDDQEKRQLLDIVISLTGK